ncbi:MAG: sensor histidine kinase [Gaiellaceae bacterium]
MAYLGAGLVVVLAYFLVPQADWRPKFALYALVSFSAVAALAYGIRRYRPAHRLVWVLFAASQVVYFAADITFYTYHYARHDSSYPAPADALYLGHYPFLVAGLVLLGRRKQFRLGDLIDTLIIGTAFALLVWIVLMDPYTHGGSGSHLLRLTSLAYPVMDLMLLFAAIRLIGPGLRVPAMSFLAGGLLFLLFSDFVYGWLQAKGRYGGPGDFLDGTWMAFYLCLGAAALSPSVRVLGAAREPAPVTLGPARIAALTGAALVAPVAAIVEDASNKQVHVLAGAIASTVLFVLVVARLADVARAQQRAQTDRERLIGRVVEVAEHERSRVAAELHSGPIQRLSALAARLELLANQVTRGEVEEAFASMHRVRDELAAEMQSLRRLMSSLRPPVVDERGLAFALEECARDVLHRTVTVGVESSVDDPLPAQIETVLYRIAREALLNASQHAQARRVDIRIWEPGEELLLSVRDDGRGFDASGFARGAAGTPGLTSMLELAQSLGGDVRVTSGRGAGTEVRAAVPLARVPRYGKELSQVTSVG